MEQRTIQKPEVTVIQRQRNTSPPDMNGDFAAGLRTMPAPAERPDFARGQELRPLVREGPDFARGQRTQPSASKVPDYARGLDKPEQQPVQKS